MSRLIVAAFALSALAACADNNAAVQTTFNDGYENGCRHGYAINGPFVEPRNENLFRDDVDYRRGWQDGHRACYDLTLAGGMGESAHP